MNLRIPIRLFPIKNIYIYLSTQNILHWIKFLFDFYIIFLRNTKLRNAIADDGFTRGKINTDTRVKSYCVR